MFDIKKKQLKKKKKYVWRFSENVKKECQIRFFVCTTITNAQCNNWQIAKLWILFIYMQDKYTQIQL